MEDFRYYESILRHREAQYLSYSLRKQMDNKAALSRFAEELMKDEQFGVLAHGQTTTVLETQRGEVNEFTSLYEKLAALITRSQQAEADKIRPKITKGSDGRKRSEPPRHEAAHISAPKE